MEVINTFPLSKNGILKETLEWEGNSKYLKSGLLFDAPYHFNPFGYLETVREGWGESWNLHFNIGQLL